MIPQPTTQETIRAIQNPSERKQALRLYQESVRNQRKQEKTEYRKRNKKINKIVVKQQGISFQSLWSKYMSRVSRVSEKSPKPLPSNTETLKYKRQSPITVTDLKKEVSLTEKRKCESE